MTTTTQNKKIGLLMAVTIAVNTMTGAGIFLIPCQLRVLAGPVGIVSMAIIAFGVWCMGISFGRLAQLFPHEGSFYEYVRSWAGRRWGIVTSASYLFGIMAAAGLLAGMAGSYLQPTFPQTSVTVISVGVLALLVAGNLAGAVLSHAGQYVLLVLTLLPLIVITCACIPYFSLSNLVPFAPFGLLGAGLASKTVMFSFFGFETVSALFATVREPERTVPRAITYSIILVASLYLLFVTAIIAAVPAGAFTSAAMPVTDALKTIFPHAVFLNEFIRWSIIVTIAGTVHSLIWASGGMMTSFVHLLGDWLVPSRLAILVAGLVALTCLLSLSGGLCFNLVILAIVFAYFMSITALLARAQAWCSPRVIIPLIAWLTALMICVFTILGIINAW